MYHKTESYKYTKIGIREIVEQLEDQDKDVGGSLYTMAIIIKEEPEMSCQPWRQSKWSGVGFYNIHKNKHGCLVKKNTKVT